MKEEAKDLISKYFSRELDEQERQVFENSLTNDPDFIRQFKLFRQSKEMVDQAYDDGSKAALTEEWETDLGNYKQQKQRRQWLIAGIGIILVVLLGIYLNSKPSPKSDSMPIALVQQAWEDSPTLYYGNLRSGEQQREDSYRVSIVNSFNLYEDQKYNTAIDTLSYFTPGVPYFEDALLIKGLCYYKLEKQPEKALILMKDVINYPKSKKRGQALWYAALIHLEKDQPEKAKEYLDLIINEKHSISAKAKKLNKEVERFIE